MVQKVTEKITRERLRALQNGEQITVQCADGYDLDSQKILHTLCRKWKTAALPASLTA